MHFTVMKMEYRQSLLKESLYFSGAFSSCLYAKQVTGRLCFVYNSTYFFIFLEVAHISVSCDRFISVSSDSLDLQKTFHYQRERPVNSSRFTIGLLLLDSKAQLIVLIYLLYLEIPHHNIENTV